MDNQFQCTVRAAFVLGGFERHTDTVATLTQAVLDGLRASPLGEVTVRSGPDRPDEAQSPVLAFQAWAERRTADVGPMTPGEYFAAQAAFFAAHPGKGPTSSPMGSDDVPISANGVG